MMTIEEIINQLSSIKDNARSFISEKEVDADSNEIWNADIKACEEAAAILTALKGEGVKNTEQVLDLLFDYNLLADQYKKMREKCKKCEKQAGRGERPPKPYQRKRR